jgi:hypothetical protein
MQRTSAWHPFSFPCIRIHTPTVSDNGNVIFWIYRIARGKQRIIIFYHIEFYGTGNDHGKNPPAMYLPEKTTEIGSTLE